MRKGEIQRQAILEKAGELFGARGYTETTVDDILEALGCSKGSFYHYFDSKLSVLLALCEEKAAESFAAYQRTRVGSTRERFDALLYWMQPFRPEEEEFVYLLLRLRARGEGAFMDAALRRSLRGYFKGEMQNLLMVLGETGAAHIARPRLEDVVFEAYTAYYDELCEAVCQCARQGESPTRAVTEVVEAARFLWERVLDMAYGSVELTRLDEALALFERLTQRLRAELREA